MNKKYIGKPEVTKKCVACNGSGHYDVKNSPPCAACNGTGIEQEKSQLFSLAHEMKQAYDKAKAKGKTGIV